MHLTVVFKDDPDPTSQAFQCDKAPYEIFFASRLLKPKNLETYNHPCNRYGEWVIDSKNRLEGNVDSESPRKLEKDDVQF